MRRKCSSMLSQVLRVALPLSVALTLLGCGNDPKRLASEELPAPAARASDFALRVLPSSFEIGGSADVTHSVRVADSEGVVVEVRAQAQGLKALHFELAYDPALYTPVSAGATGELSSQDAPSEGQPPAPERAADELLQLGVLNQPGTVHHSQVLVHYEDRPGFSGAAALAEVRFALRPFEAATELTEPRATSQLEPIFGNLAMRVFGTRAPLSWDPETSALRIYHGLTGDYNQNGEVGVDDIVPLALHFGKYIGLSENSAAAVCDGDNNREVNAADIARIAANFGRRVTSYEVYVQDEIGLPYPRHGYEPESLEPTLTVPLGELQGNRATERVYFETELADLTGRVVWCRPRDQLGKLHVPNQLHLVEGTGFWSRTPLREVELLYDPDARRLSWYPYHPGDHDSNGEVNGADILGGRDSFKDGILDGWDHVPIMMRFTHHYPDCEVFMTVDPESVPSDEPYQQGMGEMVGHGLSRVTVDLPSGAYVWVTSQYFHSKVYQLP